MNRDLNDPRLTAYALDELDSAERAEFERLLSDWPEGREAVAEIRATAELLSGELATDMLAADVLTRDQRQVIEARLDGQPAKVAALPARRKRNWAIPAAIAASFVALLAAGVVYFNQHHGAGERLVVAKADGNLGLDAVDNNGDLLVNVIDGDLPTESSESHSAQEEAQGPRDVGLLLGPDKKWQLSLRGEKKLESPYIIDSFSKDVPRDFQIGDLSRDSQLLAYNWESSGSDASDFWRTEAHLWSDTRNEIADNDFDIARDVSIGNTAPRPADIPDFRAIVGKAAPDVSDLDTWVVDFDDKSFIGNGDMTWSVNASGGLAYSNGESNHLTLDGVGSVNASALDFIVADAKGTVPAVRSGIGSGQGQPYRPGELSKTFDGNPAYDPALAAVSHGLISGGIPGDSGDGLYSAASNGEQLKVVDRYKATNAIGLAPSLESDPLLKNGDHRDSLYTYLIESRANGTDNDGDGLTDEDRLPGSLQVLNDGRFNLSYMDPGDFRIVSEALGLPGELPSTEQYAPVEENEFLYVYDNPLSTFSIDVDTASYSNVRRYLNSGRLPPPDAVRIEELLNYFDYNYAPPVDDTPFAFHSAVVECPWNPEHVLMRVAIKGREVVNEDRPKSNLVFLLDVSGSMNQVNKLTLVKYGMEKLVNGLAETDRIAIVVYAGASGLVLPSTEVGDRQAILEALGRLRAGGSTNGAAGIELAYQTAEDNFIEGGINRVILCTDGDFNVGITDRGSLTDLIEKKREKGVFLSVLGFGMGNLKDDTLETLADKGNGSYAYIDNQNEAEKVLVEGMNATLMTIAKDVKIQIEFNPVEINAYRLIGYENRVMAAQDFNDDKKDAGEIGAGHTVTALYELVPADTDIDLPDVDPLKYQTEARVTNDAYTGEIATLKLRYKKPDEDISQLLESPVNMSGAGFDQADEDFRFAASVASFGMLLRRSLYAGEWKMDDALQAAQSSLGADEYGYRAEFVSLVEKAKSLMPAPENSDD